jgi:hypothetical protein
LPALQKTNTLNIVNYVYLIGGIICLLKTALQPFSFSCEILASGEGWYGTFKKKLSISAE